MVGSPIALSNSARNRLRLLSNSLLSGAVPSVHEFPEISRIPPECDLVITPCEVNQQHGTGTLLKRYFPDQSEIVSVRSADFYSGEHEFGKASFVLPEDAADSEVYLILRHIFKSVKVRRILCVPYMPIDFVAGIAAKEIFSAPLCTYVMDDHHVCEGAACHCLAQQLFGLSDLRLVISSEMRDEYRRRFGHTFYILPPVFSHLSSPMRSEASPICAARRAAILGNIWGSRWLDSLKGVVDGSGVFIDWLCNQRRPARADVDEMQLEKFGIRLCPSVPESSLPGALAHYAFAIVPTDPLDGISSLAVEAIARFSFPSRIPTLMDAANLPIIVLGSDESVAARFVRHFSLGYVIPYSVERFKEAADLMMQNDIQGQFRLGSHRLSKFFRVEDVREWIWSSLAQQAPASHQFEVLFEGGHGNCAGSKILRGESK